jgi:hypothetical protein
MRLLRCGDFLGLPDALAAFRIGRQSMTVNNDEAIALDQKAVIAGLLVRPELRAATCSSPQRTAAPTTVCGHLRPLPPTPGTSAASRKVGVVIMVA